MNIDVRTMHIANAACCFIVAAALSAFGVGRLRRDGALQWALGWALQGTCWTLLALRGIVWDFLSIVIANSLLTATYPLFYAAIRQLQGRSYSRGWVFLPPVVTFIFFLYFAVYTDNLPYRVMYISALALLQTGALVWVLVHDAPIQERRSYWLTGFAFLVTFLIWINRLMEGLTLPHGQLTVLAITALRTASIMAAFGSAILSTLGFLLMIRGRAEHALRESEERFRLLFDGSRDAMMIAVPPSWKFTAANPAAAEMFRAKDPAAFTALGPWDISPEWQPDGSPSPDKARQMNEAALREGFHFFEWTHRRLGGEEFPATVLLTRIEMAGQTFIQGTIRDITEWKRMEENLRTSRDELERRVQERTAELSRAYEKLAAEMTERTRVEEQLRQAHKMEALGRLSGGIAHDFNNILAIIMGFSELVKEKLPKGSPEEGHLRRIVEASLRGREVIKQILTFSHQMPREKKPLQLSDIVDDTLKLLRASIPSTINIRNKVETESGPVLADPVEIQQVLMNLCTNAAHAMRGKGGTLDVELSDYRVPLANAPADHMEPGLYTRLIVRDTGVGIAPEIRDKIFDPYFTTKKVGEGSGLGLSTVMGIVKHAHGSITVESAPGEGSTFTVCLPQVGGKAMIDEVLTVEPIPGSSERILFVDDEALVVMMGEGLLRELGYEVTSKTSSRQALELFNNDPFRFDLVITDQTMPEMTGVELAKQMLAVRPEVPVILCTGFSHLVDDNSAKAAGIKGFVMKPLTQGELARTIRQVLDG